jgi:hypothetical protein
VGDYRLGGRGGVDGGQYAGSVLAMDVLRAVGDGRGHCDCDQLGEEEIVQRDTGIERWESIVRIRRAVLGIVRMNALTLLLGSIYFPLLMTSCAGIQKNAEPPPVLLHGAITYEGNKDYLPRTVVQGEPDAGNLRIRYRYDVEQGRNDSSTIFLPVVNLVIDPKGINWVIAAGNLELLEGDDVKHSYKAVHQLGGEGAGRGTTLTALRRQALLAVRDDIERQMTRDSLSGKLRPVDH